MAWFSSYQPHFYTSSLYQELLKGYSNSCQLSSKAISNNHRGKSRLAKYRQNSKVYLPLGRIRLGPIGNFDSLCHCVRWHYDNSWRNVILGTTLCPKNLFVSCQNSPIFLAGFDFLGFRNPHFQEVGYCLCLVDYIRRWVHTQNEILHNHNFGIK